MPPRVLYTGTRPPPPLPASLATNLDVCHLPLLEIRPLCVDWLALRRRLISAPPTALVFTSAHAARLADEAGLLAGLDPAHYPVWCVGPRTARRLAHHHPRMPPDHAQHLSGLAAAMAADPHLPYHVLTLGLEAGPHNLADHLPGHRIDTFAVYATGPRSSQDLRDALAPLLPLDWIALLSPRGLDALLQADPDLMHTVHLAAIGPTTKAAIEAAGLKAAAVCEVPGALALLEAVVIAARGNV